MHKLLQSLTLEKYKRLINFNTKYMLPWYIALMYLFWVLCFHKRQEGMVQIQRQFCGKTLSDLCEMKVPEIPFLLIYSRKDVNLNIFHKISWSKNWNQFNKTISLHSNSLFFRLTSNDFWQISDFFFYYSNSCHINSLFCDKKTGRLMY